MERSGSGIPGLRCAPSGLRTSPYPCPHESLYELALEQQEADEQRRRGHQLGGADDRPADALIARVEHLQADGEGTRIDRMSHEQRPEKIVTVITDRHEPVGDVDRAREWH